MKTRIDGAGWRETVALTLGEPEQVRGYVVNITSAEPGQIAGQETDPAAYRFTFEGWPGTRPLD
ncbi:hypothetical protein [Erythrobacter alti]|uniref:hypothetical protein n=1 Tax=Erythrobacter alti TaxID=1896145 RepID=UPI0030F37182